MYTHILNTFLVAYEMWKVIPISYLATGQEKTFPIRKPATKSGFEMELKEKT